MNWSDTGQITAVLVILAFARAGLFAWRTSPTRLAEGPYWYWAWAVLLISGLASEANSEWVRNVLTGLTSPLFAGLLVAGGLHYAGRPVPVGLLPAVASAGLLRAAAESSGLPLASGLISLAVEPPAAAYTAWLVHGEARRQKASWPHRCMPPFFAAIALLEAFGAWRLIGPESRLVLWPLWLAAGVPLAALQGIVGFQRLRSAESEQERDRQHRREATERLALVARHVGEVVTELNPDGTIRWISDSCREQLGLEPETLVGRDTRVLLDELGVEFAVPNALESWQPMVHPDSDSRVHGLRNAAGELRWFETQVIQDQGPDGEPRFLAVSRDVTDRIAAQQAIAASEERFRKFSLLGSDYCYVATGGRNQPVENWVTGALEEISGYSHDELQVLGFQGFIHPDDLEPGRERVMGLLREGGESSHEFRLLTKSGETRFITEKILVESAGGRFTIYGAARDITEQRRLELALARAQKLDSLGLLAGGIAHDFNNLLMVILGNAELALGARDLANVRGDLEDIVEAVDQAQALTRQLLAYAGRGAVDRMPVDLSERVRSVSELFAAAASTGVDLDLELASDLPAVIADPGEAQQLTMNLVLNAIEACQGAGRVRVMTRATLPEDASSDGWVVGELRPDTRYVLLEVGDSGVGMTQETLEKVFDPFFTTKKAGRGLGLAAVIGIVRSVHGAIRVESRPEKGTTFQVFVPACDREAVVDIAEAVQEPCAGRILVVDDDERVLRVAARILGSRGFEVETATSGAKALEAHETGSFDAVLLDAVMPGMSGAETFDELRRRDPEAVVLMASGFDKESAVGDLRERGLAGFIGKPFRADELVARITTLLSS